MSNFLSLLKLVEEPLIYLYCVYVVEDFINCKFSRFYQEVAYHNQDTVFFFSSTKFNKKLVPIS